MWFIYWVDSSLIIDEFYKRHLKFHVIGIRNFYQDTVVLFRLVNTIKVSLIKVGILQR